VNDIFYKLFSNQEYDKACNYLQLQNCSKSRYLLSVLYRYLDMYDKEYDLVMRALSFEPNNQYFQKRFQWHELEDIDKMVARPPLHLERNWRDVPQLETIEKLCFVTGADSNYYSILLECIESIRATRFYRDTPIYVIDCGLTDKEKHVIENYLCGGFIKDPGWILPIKKIEKLKKNSCQRYVFAELPNQYKAIANKAFINKIFPGHEYYFWINANSWIQDERTVDVFLKLCERRGLVFPDPSHGNARKLKDAVVKRINFIPSKYRKYAEEVRHGCDAVFCSNSSMLDRAQEIQKYFVDVNEGRYLYYFFELIQSVIVGMKKISSDVSERHYAHFNHLEVQTIGYKPIVNGDNPYVIYNQYSDDHPIGILRPTGFNDYNHVLFVKDNRNRIVGTRIGSTRYKTYPWKEKTDFKKVLLGGVWDVRQ
jgi:hypothetical protein